MPQPALTARLALRDVMLRLPERVERVTHVEAALPVFSEVAIGALQRGETAESEDHGTWRSLAGWLADATQDPTEATVLCRRTALTITVDARVPPDMPADVQLLPLADEPNTHLEWTTNTGEILQHPIAAMLDVGRRKLTLLLKFDDTQEGRELYGKMVATLTAATLKPTAVVSCVHTYSPRIVHNPDLDNPNPRRPGRNTPGDSGPGPGSGGNRLMMFPQPLDAAEPGLPVRNDALRAEVMRLPIDRTVLVHGHVRGPVVFTPPQQTETLANGFFTATARVPVARGREDVAAFPDLPRQALNGWRQVPNRASSQPPLHFRDSDQVASFFYLPTRFKLGYGMDADDAGRPPMRAEAFRDDQGNPKVKVTLVALPFIEPTDRELLRTYLRETVLINLVPFVRLTPAAGVRARFMPDFSAGPPTEGNTLPQSIRFETLEVAPEKWLILQFSMEASDYPIFGAMLRKGLRGRVVLEADGVSQGVPVSLELDDVVTDGVKVRQMESDPNDVSIENLLSLPATLSSVRVSLLDTGPLDLIFDVEEHDLLPQAQRLAGKGSWSTRINAGQIRGWDTTVVSVGPVRVEGGTPDDWLNTVNRDSSLQPQSFRVSVSLTVPSGAAERLELVQLRLFKDGEAIARQELRMLPGGPSLDLVVNMTLEELMGREGKPASFYLEYESLHKDGSLSLPQRVQIRLAERTLVLVALVEAPGSLYTVDYQADDGTHREELDRAGAAGLVERLRTEGRRWQIYAQRADAPRDPTDHTTTPTGPAVSIVTDLLGPALADGTLKKVFVVLKAATAGAPSSTIAFDKDHQEGQEWRPASGPIPPFKYHVTYVYAGGATRQVEGTETNLLLVLVPPPAS